MSELNTGTVKRNVDEEEINKLYDRLQEAHEQRDQYKKALETIIDSEESKVCKCSQVMGKTYDGLNFIHLQKIAKAALK